jgi:hypothetical protein
MKKKKNECNHLYGFHKENNLGHGILSFLKKSERGYKLDLKFKYCPKCGEKL